MTDTTAPASVESTETAAPQVTAQTTETTKPQAATLDGAPQAEKPAGDEHAASGEDSSQDGEPKKSWKEKRQERNRERWQEFKAAKQYQTQRLIQLEQEVARLKQQAPPDFSQILDPNEELAERTAWKIQQRQAAEAEGRLQSEREIAARQQAAVMAETWQETIEEMRARVPDFDQVFTPQTPVHARAVPYIVESEKSGEIAYFLGKNPQIAQQLYDKFERSPAAALIELGRIEARVSAPPPKTISQAPRPAPILNGGANPLAFDASRASVEDLAQQFKKSGILR